MVNLFNQVYLTYSEMNPEHYPYVQIINRDPEENKDPVFEEHRLFYAKTVEDLLDQVSEEELFKILNSIQDTVYIYADPPAFKEFLTRWFKGLLPQLTEEGLCTLFKNYQSYEKLMPAEPRVPMYFLEGEGKNIYDQIDDYWNISGDKWQKFFNNYSPFSIPLEILWSCGLDLQLTQGMINPDSIFVKRLKEYFNQAYKYLFMSEVTGLIEEIKEGLISSADAHDAIPQPKDLFESIQNNDDLKCILDRNIKTSENSYDYFFNNYDVPKTLKTLAHHQHIDDIPTLIRELPNFHKGEALSFDLPLCYHFLKEHSRDPHSMTAGEIPSLFLEQNDLQAGIPRAKEDFLYFQVTDYPPFHFVKRLSRLKRFNIYLPQAIYHLIQKDPQSPLLEELNMGM